MASTEESTKLKELLDGALKDKTLLSFDVSLPDLSVLEEVLTKTMQSKLNSGALVSTAPQFDWWQEAGVWPIHGVVSSDGKEAIATIGWTVLLRRVRIQGQVRPDVAAAAQKQLIKS